MSLKKFATERVCSRLRVGMRVKDIDGIIYKVVMVNECRAVCAPENKTREVIIPQRFGDEGEKKIFMARTSAISISPNSEIEIL